MAVRTLSTLALALLVGAACDVTVDVDPDGHADHGSIHGDLEPVRAIHPDAEVWRRHADVRVFDDDLIVDLELALAPDGTYRLVAEVEDVDGDREREIVEGRYRWDGDRLVLEDDGGDGGTFRRRGEDLELETEWPVDVALAVTGLPDPTLRRAR